MAPEWNAPRFLIYRWWKSLMKRSDCSVLVFDRDGQVIGFAIYVLDEIVWREISSSGPNSRPAKLITAVFRPGILRSRIRKKRALKEATSGSSPVLPGSREASEAVAVRGNSDWKFARFFLGIIATDPRTRRTGAGTRLLEASERLAGESGSTLVRMHVDPRNDRALQFYRNHGYTTAGSDHNSLVLVKELP